MVDSADTRKKRRQLLDGRSVSAMVTTVRLALRAGNGPHRMPFRTIMCLDLNTLRAPFDHGKDCEATTFSGD